MSNTTIATLLAAYNELAAKAGKQALKSFKGRKEILQRRVDDLKALVQPTKTRKLGIGLHCMALIKAGLDNAAVLAAVKSKFPSAKTTMACVSWYRCHMNEVL